MLCAAWIKSNGVNISGKLYFRHNYWCTQNLIVPYILAIFVWCALSTPCAKCLLLNLSDWVKEREREMALIQSTFRCQCHKQHRVVKCVRLIKMPICHAKTIHTHTQHIPKIHWITLITPEFNSICCLIAFIVRLNQSTIEVNILFSESNHFPGWDFTKITW